MITIPDQRRATRTVRADSATAAVARMPTASTVVACYSVFDSFMAACGFTDLTEGMYENDPQRPYDEAQARQAEVLLDRANVESGSRLLDIGCGYGRIVKAARDRGALACGITVSPEQVRFAKREGLDVRLQDYKHLGHEWDRQFDAVIANGSIEHYVQLADAAAGRDNELYRHLFETVHRLLDPESTNGRLVSTVIHFHRRPRPADLLRRPSAFPYDSPSFHWARLARSLGGWYPVRGQLEACAEGYFELMHEEDGTDDYRLTSEACLAAVRQRLFSVFGAGIWLRSLPAFMRRPVHSVRLLRCIFGSESWNRQFRGDPTPAILLRQTWQRI